MNRFLIPNISRIVLAVSMPLGMIFFLVILLVDSRLFTISHDFASIGGVLLILPIFSGDYILWAAIIPSMNRREEIRFLSTLPVSRKRIARDNIKLFFYVHACFYFIPLILVIGLLLFLPASGMHLLRYFVECLCFATVTLLTHLISCKLKNELVRAAFSFLPFLLVIMPLWFFLAFLWLNADAVTVILVLIVSSLILTGISLLVQRRNEYKFMVQDLL
jgi:hypothetical protein